MKKLIALILCLLMLLPAALTACTKKPPANSTPPSGSGSGATTPAPATPTPEEPDDDPWPEETGPIVFTNDLRGSAAGTYTFTAEKAGKCTLYWAAADGSRLTATVGGKVLEYTDLAEIDAKAGENTFSPQPFTAIPYGAKKLVVASGDTTVYTFELPEEKLLEKAPSSVYGVMSDLHFNTYEDGGKDASIIAVGNALEFYKSVGVEYVFVTGDLSTNADEEAYEHYKDTVDKSGVTVLCCGGNHEVVSGYDKMYGADGLFYKYVNVGVYDGTLEGVLEVAPNKHDFVFQIPGTDDIFIAVCQARWDSSAPSMKPLIEPETIDWMETVLEKYKDKKAHLLMHTFLADDDYDHVDGEGDISNKAGFGYAYYWNVYSEEDARLRDLFDRYDDLIWFNGHSHWIFEMQKYNENLSVFDYGGVTATMVHVPSVTAPRTTADTETEYHSNVGKLSEGILMFAEDGYEFMNGINFKTGKIEAYACYIIYDNENVLEKGKIGDVDWTVQKQLGALRISGAGAMPDLASKNDQPYRAFNKIIRSVYVGKDVTAIGANAFAGLQRATSIEIKDGTASIGKNAFANCPAVKELILPETLTAVGERAFPKLGEGVAVTFTGTPEKYGAISVLGGNEGLTAANTVCEKRTVTWKLGDYATTEILKVGTVPVYGGTGAMPADDPNSYLPLTGWNNGSRTFKSTVSLPKLTENVTYTAIYGDKADRYVGDKLTEKVSWSLDRLTGVLTLTGTSDSTEFASSSDPPWKKYSSEIYIAIVKTGVKTVGKNSFAKLSNLTTVIVEEKVTALKGDCFAYNDALTEVWLPSTLRSLSQGVSYQCNNLKNINFAGSKNAWKKLVLSAGMYNDVLVDADDVHLEATLPTSRTYTVTFVGADGAVLRTVEGVEYCGSAEPPAAPEVAGKTFVGWDGTFFLVREDMTITAVYAPAAE